MNQRNLLVLAGLGIGGLLLLQRIKQGKPLLSGVNSSAVVDTILPWVNINPQYKPIIGMAAKKVLSNHLGEDVLEAEWKQL